VNGEWTQSSIMKHVSMMQQGAVEEIQMHCILPMTMLSRFINTFHYVQLKQRVLHFKQSLNEFS
jgi:hypothetical protein